MLNNEELLQLRSSYIEVGRMVQQYGFGQYNGVLNILAAKIKCIDSNFEKKKKEEYLIESYKGLFRSKGGLSDFIIYDKNDEKRDLLNKKFNDELQKIWEILKEKE